MLSLWKDYMSESLKKENARLIDRVDELQNELKLKTEALDAFMELEFATKADWLGLCAFRMSEVRCRGTDGHNSALGKPNPTPHSPHCPYSKVQVLLGGKA